MQRRIFSTILFLGLFCFVSAQQGDEYRKGLPFLRGKDKVQLMEQADSFFEALRPLSEQGGRYAFNVYRNGKHVARSTMTSYGLVTKWSEVNGSEDPIYMAGHDGVLRLATLDAVLPDYDLALFQVDEHLDAVPFTEPKKLQIGAFLFAAGSSKEAHGFGVVSVAPRSLRASDRGFLGVSMDFTPVDGGGVRLQKIVPDSAAEKAGLRAGDVVTAVNDHPVNSLRAMSNRLQKFKPKSKVKVRFRREGTEVVVDVVLGSRPEKEQSSAACEADQMKKMGGEINAVAEGFPYVLQSDMQVDRRDVGSPVFDLDGDFVGLVIARASRIKTYIIPAETLEKALRQRQKM